MRVMLPVTLPFRMVTTTLIPDMGSKSQTWHVKFASEGFAKDELRRPHCISAWPFVLSWRDLFPCCCLLLVSPHAAFEGS